MKQTDTDQYFKITDDRVQYLGLRFFRYNHMSEKTIQVCKTTGELKRGRTNTFGIHLIHRLTFLSNYLSMGYAVPITKKEYEKQFNEVLKMLQ